MLPPLCALLLTYSPSIDHPRSEYASVTIQSTLNRLKDYDGELRVHIADDGSPEEHREKLREIAGGYKNVISASCTNSQRAGYGVNYNLALQTVHLHSYIILPLEDDWELSKELPINELVQTLTEAEPDGIGCIRLGYLGWTQPLRGELCHYTGHTYLRLDPESPEPHVWAGHPRLETRAFQRKIEPWPEGLDPGTTEFVVANRKAAREGVLWPMDLIQGYGDLYKHIGQVQARTDQIPEEATTVG